MITDLISEVAEAMVTGLRSRGYFQSFSIMPFSLMAKGHNRDYQQNITASVVILWSSTELDFEKDKWTQDYHLYYAKASRSAYFFKRFYHVAYDIILIMFLSV